MNKLGNFPLFDNEKPHNLKYGLGNTTYRIRQLKQALFVTKFEELFVLAIFKK